MAVTIQPAKQKIFAIIIGTIIAITALFFGTNTLLTRAIDEEPQAVTITNITSTSADIEWETGQAVQGAVRYGQSSDPASLTAIAPEVEPTKNHKVQLTLLEAGQTYYFEIIGGTDTPFNNQGTPWTFTTATDDGIPTSEAPSGRSTKPIQRLVIEENGTTANPPINCATEPNCELIKANFANGCSTSHYVACEQRNNQ